MSGNGSSSNKTCIQLHKPDNQGSPHPSKLQLQQLQLEKKLESILSMTMQFQQARYNSSNANFAEKYRKAQAQVTCRPPLANKNEGTQIQTIDIDNSNSGIDSIFYVDDNSQRLNLKPIHYKQKGKTFSDQLISKGLFKIKLNNETQHINLINKQRENNKRIIDLAQINATTPPPHKSQMILYRDPNPATPSPVLHKGPALQRPANRARLKEAYSAYSQNFAPVLQNKLSIHNIKGPDEKPAQPSYKKLLMKIGNSYQMKIFLEKDLDQLLQNPQKI